MPADYKILSIMLEEQLLNQQVCGDHAHQHVLKQTVWGSHACTKPSESAGVGDELYGYVCVFSFAIMDSTTLEPAAACTTVDGKAADMAIHLIPNTC